MIREFFVAFCRVLGLMLLVFGGIGTATSLLRADDPSFPAEYCEENSANDNCKRNHACNSGHGPSSCTWDAANTLCCCPYNGGPPSECDD